MTYYRINNNNFIFIKGITKNEAFPQKLKLDKII